MKDFGIAVWEYNLRTHQISFDANMLGLFGFSKFQSEISFTDWLNKIVPGEREQTFQRIQESINDLTPMDLEFELGEPARVIKCTGRVYTDPNKDSRLLGLCIDITKEVAARRQAQARNVKDVSVSKAKALSQLSAGIAHEINNPLTIILGHAENLIYAASRGLVPSTEISKSTSSILSACQRISHIVRGLRNFARDGSQDPIETTGLSQIFEHVLALCRSRFRNHEIDLRFKAPPQNLMVFCRSTELEQALFYLLSQAFDSAADSDEKWVEVETRDLDKVADILITSSQQVISEDIRNQLKNPLLELDITGDGSLLGLSIAKGIVDSVGGKMTLNESSNFFQLVIQVPKSPPPSG